MEKCFLYKIIISNLKFLDGPFFSRGFEDRIAASLRICLFGPASTTSPLCGI